jgi:hypothetical protein
MYVIGAHRQAAQLQGGNKKRYGEYLPIGHAGDRFIDVEH